MNNNHLPYIVGLLHEIHSISIRICDENGSSLQSWLREQVENPIGQSSEELVARAKAAPGWGLVPVMLQTEIYELYLALPVGSNKDNCLLVGPVLSSDISMAVVDRILHEGGWPIRHKPALMRHYREIPQIEYREFCKIGMMLWTFTHDEELDFFDLIDRKESGSTEQLQHKLRSNAENAWMENRRKNFRHHSPHIENLIMESIRQGDVTRLTSVMKDFPMDGSNGILSRGDPLRSVKNNVICMITLATRAAISGGLHYEEAFTISDEHIQQLEELGTQEAIFALSIATYRELAERTKAASSHGYSLPVEKCRAHLFRNLYMDVRLDELAKLSGVNKNRLISKFREETGLTPHQWMLRERVREAQRLLRGTGNSVTDISIALNFHDVSHFTKTFRKIAGISPHAWRKDGGQPLLVN